MLHFTEFTRNTENTELFKTFEPKIKAYRDELAKSILCEYKLPEELIPDCLGVDVTEIPLKILSEKEQEITDLSASVLVKKISSGEFTSTEVFRAYAKRATAAQQLTNCAMQLFIEEGLERAKFLDDYYVKTGKTIGPLHGLPISVKEHMNFKNKITTAGFACWIENVTKKSALMTELLEEAGAVFYVRTTEPQTMMHLCSKNNITGFCLNPANTALTPGGSSSGEAAIAAMKGSAIGIGSDIGGSIRCPAAFCGVWGLKPTQKRLTLKQTTAPSFGVSEGVYPVCGPLARCADDINLCMKTILDKKPWEKDATLVPMPWRDVTEPNIKNLTVAICMDDGVVKPTAPILRGLKFAREKLIAAGAKIVEWKPVDVIELVNACYSMYNCDGCRDDSTILAMSGEPLCKLTKVAMTFGCGEKGLTVTESTRLKLIRDVHRNKYQDIMRQNGIDFILTPAYVSVAAKPETVHYWGYTCLWNLLDYPGIVFPTGLKCEPAIDIPDTNYIPRNEIEEYERSLYDNPEDFKGAPISLQLIGRRWFEEELVKAAKVIQATIAA